MPTRTKTSYLELIKPQYNEDADVVDINANMDLIDAVTQKFANNFAGAFDEGLAYDAGKCVLYGNEFYILPDGHTAYTTWANTTKTKTSLSNVLTDLKADFAKQFHDVVKDFEEITVPATENLWNKDNTHVGYLHKNGNVYSGGTYDNYVYGSIGEVTPGDVIKFYTTYLGYVSLYDPVYIVCYKEDGTVDESAGTNQTSTFTVPEGIKSISITVSGTYSPTVMALKNNESAPASYIPYREAYTYYVATEDFIRDAFDELIYDVDGKFVTPENTSFFHISKNIIDPSKQVHGEFVNQQSGIFQEYSGQNRSDYSEVEPSTVYVIRGLSGSKGFRYAFYNSDKTYISGALMNETNDMLITSPAHAQYIVISDTDDMTICMVAKYEDEDKSFEYYDNIYILNKYIKDTADNIVLNIPEKIYALSGYELNIYFENITEDWTKYSWDVSCAKGRQMERGYNITPTDADAGTYDLSITAKISEDVYKTVSTSLIIVASSAGSGESEKIIVLGDSTTDYGVMISKLNANFSNDVMTLSTLGTRGTAPNNHEGRSGWKFYNYCITQQDNPFYNPVLQGFDASYYFENSEIAIPDWFFVNLGINDMFGCDNDTSLNSIINTTIGYCDEIIESVKDADENIKIGVCLTIPPNHSQDAFGKAYACNQNRNRCKRNNTLWVKRLIAEYDGREDENIYLVPINTNLDTVYNMGMETLPVNARNTSVTYQSPIANGGVHPVESGYWQIADVFTAFIKAHA